MLKEYLQLRPVLRVEISRFVREDGEGDEKERLEEWKDLEKSDTREGDGERQGRADHILCHFIGENVLFLWKNFSISSFCCPAW